MFIRNILRNQQNVGRDYKFQKLTGKLECSQKTRKLRISGPVDQLHSFRNTFAFCSKLRMWSTTSFKLCLTFHFSNALVESTENAFVLPQKDHELSNTGIFPEEMMLRIFCGLDSLLSLVRTSVLAHRTPLSMMDVKNHRRRRRRRISIVWGNRVSDVLLWFDGLC